MKLLDNTLKGLNRDDWTYMEAFTYFVKGATRELGIAPSVFMEIHKKFVRQRKQKRLQEDRKAFLKSSKDTSCFDALERCGKMSVSQFKNDWLKLTGSGESYFDIKGAKLADISDDPERIHTLVTGIFEDVFLIPVFFNDCYDKSVVNIVDRHMDEGPYGYVDGAFDVTVKKGDLVIDAGAWIGDFSAYAASKGAVAYAFEPVAKTFQVLCKTAKLNDGKIYPVQKGLACCEGEAIISATEGSASSSSIAASATSSASEKIDVTTLDKFVEENRLERVDFIKADIEGVERDMLRGATNVLKTFAPKLAICTYHLLDDPETLEKIIVAANPRYKVVHLRHKLLAAVV
jgi:FkbM family methyltransferase